MHAMRIPRTCRPSLGQLARNHILNLYLDLLLQPFDLGRGTARALPGPLALGHVCVHEPLATVTLKLSRRCPDHRASARQAPPN